MICTPIIGHKAGGMTYGLYAGDLDWDKAVEAMAKVDFKKAAQDSVELHFIKNGLLKY